MRYSWRAVSWIAMMVVLGVAAVVFPWSNNEVAGSRSAAEVFTDHSWAAAVVLGAGMVLAMMSLPGQWGRTRRQRLAGAGGALCTVLATAYYAAAVSLDSAWPYGRTADGHEGHWEVESRPGPGLWCAAGLGLILLALHTLPLLDRSRKAGRNT